jgi:hypothetical protein
LRISTEFQKTCSFSTTHGSITQLNGDRSVVKISGDNVINFLQVIHPPLSLPVHKSPPPSPLLLIKSITDTHNNPIAEHSWDNIFVKGRLVHPDLARLAPVDHGFPEFTAGNLLWTQVIPVSFDQGFRYAGVSGDHVAHAIDDEAARREGLPGKIVQGLCTYAMCTGAVVRNAADDDPGRLRRITARLSAPLRPGTDLTVNCFDAGRTDDGYRCVAFEAEAGGVTVLKHGRAAIS